MSFTRSRFFKLGLASLSLTLILTSTISAQGNPPSTPTFVSGSSLVMVPTVVTDKSGAHLKGLTKDNFTIYENDRPQKPVIFEEVHTESGRIRTIDPRDAGFTNVVSPEAHNQRLTMILIDTLNTRFQDQVRAREELLKFIDDTLQPGEPVALMVIGSDGLTIINDFTVDPKVLSSSVKGVRAHLSAEEKTSASAADLEMMLRTRRELGLVAHSQESISDQLLGFRDGFFDRVQGAELGSSAEITLRALRQIAEAFSGVPGRKSLIWATGGLPFIADDTSVFEIGRNRSVFALYQSAWEAMNKAQITVYPLDMGGLFSPGFVSPRFRGYYRTRRMVDNISNLETFATMTGGEFCSYKMNLSGCFESAQSDAQQYYLLGYYLDKSKSKPGWRKLRVTVDRPNAHVRAKTSFYVSTKVDDRKEAEREDTTMAILSPTDFTAVPLLVRWVSKTPEGAKTRYKFRFNVPAAGFTIDKDNNNLIDLVFGAFAKTGKGGVAGEFEKELQGKLPEAMVQQIAQQGIMYEGEILIPAGEYTVRFMVRDNLSGRLGTVSVPVNN